MIAAAARLSEHRYGKIAGPDGAQKPCPQC